MGSNLGLGVLGYLALLVAIVGSMALAARAAARLLGVRDFRWFRVTFASRAWWRLLLVWAAAALAPWCVSVTLLWLPLWLEGEQVMTTRVEVLEGAAREAGVRNGDRILTIDGKRIDHWDSIKPALQTQSPVALEVERDGTKLTISVTPRDGRIGVTPVMERNPLGPLQAALVAAPLPGRFVRESIASLTRTLSPHAHVNLKGPVGIVLETARAPNTSALFYLLGVLSAYYWPFFASIALFDAFTTALFCATQPSAPSWPSRAQRLARLQQTILLSLGCYVLGLVSVVLASVGNASGAIGIVLGMSLMAAAYPLLWLGAAEVWRPVPHRLLVLGAFLMPCLVLGALIALLIELRKELRAEGFRAGGLRVFPTKPPSATPAT